MLDSQLQRMPDKVVRRLEYGGWVTRMYCYRINCWPTAGSAGQQFVSFKPPDRWKHVADYLSRWCIFLIESQYVRNAGEPGKMLFDNIWTCRNKQNKHASLYIIYEQSRQSRKHARTLASMQTYKETGKHTKKRASKQRNRQIAGKQTMNWASTQTRERAYRQWNEHTKRNEHTGRGNEHTKGTST